MPAECVLIIEVKTLSNQITIAIFCKDSTIIAVTFCAQKKNVQCTDECLSITCKVHGELCANKLKLTTHGRSQLCVDPQCRVDLTFDYNMMIPLSQRVPNHLCGLRLKSAHDFF